MLAKTLQKLNAPLAKVQEAWTSAAKEVGCFCCYRATGYYSALTHFT